MKKNIVIIFATVAVTLIFVAAYLQMRDQVQKIAQQEANFPFEVKFRKAVIGNGYINIFVNKSDVPQSVKVTLENPTLNQSKTYSLVVDAHHFAEIGYAQGWAGSSGDQITLECNGVSMNFHIP